MPIFSVGNKAHTDPKVQIMQPSSDAQSLGKFAEIPVDLYTGRTNINKDLLGNIRETYIHPEAGYKECIQRIQYYPSGLPWAETAGASEQPWKYNGKEFVEMHGLDEYDSKARWYYPAICRTTTMDPLAEKYYATSPYAWCLNNPIKYIDPDGNNPIYDTLGNFLGTDDLGIQGNYYVMNKGDFTQGMSHIDAGNHAVLGSVADDVEEKINTHYGSLPKRPDYDGFVTVKEGINWAKSHLYALENPTPDNMLYIDASKLDYGALSTSDFPIAGAITAQNLFVTSNIVESLYNPKLMATVYALGRVDMILTNRAEGTVKILNNNATDCDWNVGGGIRRDLFIRANNGVFNINPKVHGFKTSYYGVGTLRK